MSQVSLLRTGILAFMDDEARGQLAPYGKIVSTTPGQVIIREGEAGAGLFIVLSGIFEITTKQSGQDVYLDTLADGDCVGEVAVFEPGVASATVTGKDHGRLWRIEEETLQQYLFNWPYAGCALVLGINTLLSRRLRRATDVIKANEIVPVFLSVRSRKRA
jgi:CRP/FNR family cyclic AMP-dependent transcriptional regulator